MAVVVNPGLDRSAVMLRCVLLTLERAGNAVKGRNTQTCLCNATYFSQISARKFADAPNPTAEEDEVRFGDYPGPFSSRMSFRKSSAELQDAKHTDAEVEQDEPNPNFRPRNKKRNTPYWYLLQCKKLLKKDKLAEALALFEVEMLKEERLQPEEYNYTVLIGGCGRVGYIKKAFKLYNDMKKRGLEPSAAAYTALFNACAESPWKQSALEQALKLRQELRRKNIPLNAITHHALLKTLARAGDLRACFQVLREMLQSGQAITQETFQYLLMCCVEDKEQGFRLALQVWHQMLSAGIKPDGQNYNIILRAARDCGIGDPALASKLLLRGWEESQLTAQGKGQRSRLRKGTCDPEPLDVDAFERLVLTDTASDLTQANLRSDSTQAQLIPVSSSSRLSPALKSPLSVPNLLDPSTCHSDVVALATASTAANRLVLIGDLDGFLNKMSSDGLKPSIKTLTLLADVTEPGSQSVRSLMDAAFQSGVQLDVGFFNTLIRKAAKAGDVNGAKAVKALMLERKLRLNAQTFCSLALACRSLKDGLQLLTDMQACGVAGNAHVFSALIGQAMRRLDYAWLHELLQQMHQLQVSPNDVIIKQLEFATQYPPTYDQIFHDLTHVTPHKPQTPLHKSPFVPFSRVSYHLICFDWLAVAPSAQIRCVSCKLDAHAGKLEDRGVAYDIISRRTRTWKRSTVSVVSISSGWSSCLHRRRRTRGRNTTRPETELQQDGVESGRGSDKRAKPLMEPDIEVIVLSDDEDTGGDHTGALDNSSILIVEDNDDSKDLSSETSETLDEDVTITFSRKANVLPHARYDCTVSFSFTDSNISVPESSNAAYCEQCFCYICDHLASQCTFWTVPGFCHCNAHKRSVYWKSLRDKRIMGYLHELKFNFNPADMDSDLRRAETSLQEFAHSLALKYAAFFMAMGNPIRQAACACVCHSTNRTAAQSSLANGSAAGCARCYIEHQKFVLYDYTPVMEYVHAFLDDTIKENPKAGSVMVLGAIKLFITHATPGSMHAPAISQVLLELFWRAMSIVQVLFVDADFPASFIKQLQDFFQILPLPPDFRKFRNGLNVLSWDDPLLSAVLKGQNITGVRHVKGRRSETLDEALVVVRTRVLKLQQQNRYRELARYLRVVKSDNAAKLQMMRDWVPLYLCKVGDYAGAADSLLSPMYSSLCPASRVSPAQFGAYLRIFISGHAPTGKTTPTAS
ncbi:hypothetical protein QTP86_030410 [Hemibagrus guttatus]|nr:hypothetical protein QTP86_030410 [Hemibagrus guttatus]